MLESLIAAIALDATEPIEEYIEHDEAKASSDYTIASPFLPNVFPYLLGPLGHSVHKLTSNQPENTMRLRSNQSAVCIFAGMQGGAAGARVYVGADGYWVLERFTPRTGYDDVSANCFSLSAFKSQSNPAATVRWTSQNLETYSKVEVYHACAEETNLLPFTLRSGYDAAFPLQGVRRERSTFSELDIWTPGYVHGCGVTVYSNQFYAGPGVELERIPRYQASFYPNFSPQLGYPIERKRLIPVSEGICYLQQITGNIGENDLVRIVRDGNDWYLEASLGPGTYHHFLFVDVECYAAIRR
jgi:hypothetical protein